MSRGYCVPRGGEKRVKVGMHDSMAREMEGIWGVYTAVALSARGMGLRIEEARKEEGSGGRGTSGIVGIEIA